MEGGQILQGSALFNIILSIVMFAILPRYWRDKESILIIKSVFSAFVNVRPTFQQAIEENFNFTIESFRFEDENEYEYEI